jgi:hypothetical protein
MVLKRQIGNNDPGEGVQKWMSAAGERKIASRHRLHQNFAAPAGATIRNGLKDPSRGAKQATPERF